MLLKVPTLIHLRAFLVLPECYSSFPHKQPGHNLFQISYKSLPQWVGVNKSTLMWSQTPTYVITLPILLLFCRRLNNRAGFHIAYYNFTTHQILVRNNVTRGKLCIYANENIDLLFPDQVDVFKSRKVRQAKLITKAIREVFSTFLHFIRYW